MIKICKNTKCMNFQLSFVDFVKNYKRQKLEMLNIMTLLIK